ncbi:MAG TPA: N-formylglutamate amidohydrolase [Chryseosolibacter sp.]
MDTYRIKLPAGRRVPVVVSVPHCGTAFPEEIKDDYRAELIKAPDDTDWFVDRLYGFAPSIGITMISAVLSRWVIDLNRSPADIPLYSDGRIITGLCPTTTFLGDPLYKDGRSKVEAEEIKRRTELYYRPYHAGLREILDDLKSEFGQVLLWDCHSIRQRVPTLYAGKFPDLILGSADGRSAEEDLIEIALDNLVDEGYTLHHNEPFKGGYVTRNYGRPEKGEHALQLEMSKINYMDDFELQYEPVRAERIGKVLHKTLGSLGDALLSAKDY